MSKVIELFQCPKCWSLYDTREEAENCKKCSIPKINSIEITQYDYDRAEQVQISFSDGKKALYNFDSFVEDN
jgi:hypothetical protein